MRYRPRLVQPIRTPVEEKTDDVVSSVWRIWVQTTDRDEDTELSDEKRTIIDDALTSNQWSEKPDYLLERTVRSGAYLPPVHGDDQDMSRLVAVLSDEQQRDQALQDMNDIDSDPYLFPFIEETLDAYRSVAVIVGAEPDSADPDIWSLLDYDEDDVLKSVSDMKSDDAEVDAHSVLEHLLSYAENLYPSTSKENRATAQSAEKNKEEQAYYSARTIDEISVLVRNDLQAMDMINQGFSVPDIAAHHGLAPEGYWTRVDEKILEPGINDLMDAYDALEEEFSFHAEDRPSPVNQ